MVAANIQHIFAVTEQTGDGTRSTAHLVRELSRSAEELKQINQQPIIPSIQNRAETGKSDTKQPSFTHQEADGTKIKEYRESGKSTEVVVQTGVGTRYEMSNPQDSANPKIRNQDVNRVPSVKLPF